MGRDLLRMMMERPTFSIKETVRAVARLVEVAERGERRRTVEWAQ